MPSGATVPRAHAPSHAAPPIEPASRTAKQLLGACVILGALLQIALLAREWSANPFARTPLNDAKVYWDWAGEIARGRLVGETPFFSAPLYPYFVGLVRALVPEPVELVTLYLAQALMHLATAALVFRVARLRGGLAAATVAALAWILLDDAAYGTARVLNGPLQCLCVAWLAERALVLHAAPSVRRAAWCGAALGLATLATSTMLVLVPVFAPWAVWIASTERAKHGLALLATAIALVLPATVHNAIACGELIPVSAQAGVTFRHGNAPGADGTYHAIAGVSSDRVRQNVDARELVRGETDGSWNATSSAYFAKGLAYWREDPARAARLILRRAWWFASGHDYGDVYVPALEAEDGWSIAERVAPLRAPWILWPALVAALFALRELRARLPELLLLLTPLAIVAAFWYSPRYRLPAMPVACVLAACALAVPRPRARAIAAWIALAAGVATGAINASTGFDALEPLRAQYAFLSGQVLSAAGRDDDAASAFRRATALGHPEAGAALGDALRKIGRPQDALAMLRDNALRFPQNAYAHRALAVALAQSRDLVGARAEFEAALRIDPSDAEALSGLGGVLYEGGDVPGAVERLRRAVALRPDDAGAHHNLGVALEGSGDFEAAKLEYAAALHADPKLARAAHRLAVLHVSVGDFREALRELARALERTPGDRELTTTSAWLYATAPDAADRDGKKALAMIEPLAAADPRDPGLANIEAAALAECGRFAEAERVAVRAVTLLAEQGADDAVKEMQERLELYRTGRAYHQPRR